MKRLWAAVVVGVSVVATPALHGQTAAPEAVQRVTDVDALMTAKQWKEAAAGISQLLDAKATSVDRTALLKLRAECQLQLNQDAAALATLETIRAQAVKDAAKSDEAWAGAFALLIKRKLAGYVYVPRTADVKTPIDVLNREKRTDAYKALLADELATYRETAKKAAAGKSILPILDLADRLAGLRGVELVVTGKAVETDAMAKTLTDTSSKLITQAEDDYSQRVASISAESNKGKPRKRDGIDAGESAELGRIRSDCERIVATVHRLRTLTGREETLENALSRAERIRERVDVVAAGKPDPIKSLPRARKDTE
jgi:hypothetical protein